MVLQVLFQNDSPASLLARVIGIIGPIDQDMLAKGRDTYKYFTKNHMLYERNQVNFRFLSSSQFCPLFNPDCQLPKPDISVTEFVYNLSLLWL